MTPEEYVEQRLVDQMNWHDRKSVRAQSVFKGLRRTEIVCAALIPLCAGFTQQHAAIPIVIGLLGAVIVVLSAFQSLGQYGENWVQYRATSESLRREKLLYETATPPYDAEAPFPVLVERVERILSVQNGTWTEHTREGAKKSEPGRGTA